MNHAVCTHQVLDDPGYRHCDLMARYGVKCPCRKWLFRLPDGILLGGDRSILWYQTRVCIWCDLAIETSPTKLLLMYSYHQAMMRYRRRKAK